jgi:hypothetical protein
LGPRTPPLWIRMADRMLKFGYFYLDDLKERLYRFDLDLQAEERSNINYIFRAAKCGLGLPFTHKYKLDSEIDFTQTVRHENTKADQTRAVET